MDCLNDMEVGDDTYVFKDDSKIAMATYVFPMFPSNENVCPL